MITLVVKAAHGLATVQDAGRPGRMHDGIPPGGAMVPELLAAANRAVGNRQDAAAIEVFGGVEIAFEVAVEGRPAVAGAGAARPGTVLVAIDEMAEPLAAGEARVCAPHPRRRARYVAIAGGLEVPVVLGGRGTLLVAGLGGHEGRALRRGDRLAVGRGAGPEGIDRARSGRDDAGRDVAAASVAHDDPARAIRVVPGPDAGRFAQGALDALVDGAFRVALAGDRAGVRLEGPALARRDGDDALSAPMVAGAIEVPASGAPIVLGPDHPTTGGYPVIATVVRADLGALLGRKPGAAVRFVLA